MAFSATIDLNPTQKALGIIKRAGPVAQMRSLNRAISTGRTHLSRIVSKDMGLKVGVVKKKMILAKAKKSLLRAAISASTKRIPLIDFGARGPEPSFGKGKGVSAKTGPSRKRYPNAFIATVSSGHRGVFQRSAKGRLPVRELRGPSIGHVFDKHQNEGKKITRAAFVKELEHQMRYALQKAAQRRK